MNILRNVVATVLAVIVVTSWVLIAWSKGAHR